MLITVHSLSYCGIKVFDRLSVLDGNFVTQGTFFQPALVPTKKSVMVNKTVFYPSKVSLSQGSSPHIPSRSLCFQKKKPPLKPALPHLLLERSEILLFYDPLHGSYELFSASQDVK